MSLSQASSDAVAGALPPSMLPGSPLQLRRGADGIYEVTAADLFCGAGGTSTGLVEAVEELEREHGVKIRLSLTAVNHWDVAIETHSANHKFAQHHCNSLKGVQPRKVIPGILDLLVASPECTHHSNARGGKPMDDQSRSSGNDVIRWVSELKPGFIVLENVREWRTWGPLNKNNRPIKSRKGEYFQQFLSDIRALGYQVEDRLICCADQGDPTTRTRLFIFCKRNPEPIAWPPATHAKNRERLLVSGLEKWRTAREDVIDWKDLGTSIFNRKKPLSRNTMRRIEAGLYKFSGIDLRGFLVKLYGTSDAASADAPAPTVTGQGGHLGLAVPVPFQIRTDCTGGKTAGYRSIDDPTPTVVGSGGLGVVDPKTFILPKEGVHGGNLPRSVDEPAQTVVPHHGLGYVVSPAFLLGQNHTPERPAPPRSVDEPVPTVLAKGAIAKVEPFMVAHFGEREGQEPRVHSVDEPTPAVTSRGAAELAQPFIAEYHDDKAGEPRVKPVDEPLPTQDCSNRFGLAQPFVVTAAHGTKTPEENIDRRARSVDEPLGAQTGSNEFGLAQPFMLSAGGPEVAPRSTEDPAHTVLTRDHIGLAAPFIAGAGGPSGQGRPQSVDDPLGTVIGENHRAVVIPVTHAPKDGEEPRVHSVEEPLPTVTAAHRGELGVAQPTFILPQTSTGAPRSVEDPVPTITTTSRGIGVATAFLVQYNGTAETQSVDKPLGSLTGKPRFALLVTFVDGSKCLLDILFRMLRQRELARAQSFPDSYQFMGKTEDIVKQIGNAVPVKTAKRLCKWALLQCWRPA